MESEDRLLPGCQTAEQFIQHFFQLLADQLLLGLGCLQVFQQGPQRSLLPVAGGHIQRADVRRELQKLFHLFRRQIHPPGDLLSRGLQAVLLTQVGPGGLDLAHPFCRMHRHPDGAAVVEKAPGHALADPFRGVCRKPEIPGIVELSGGCQQANAPLLNEIQQGHPPARVFLGHGDHQPQIAVDHLPDGLLVSLSAALGQLPLLLRRQPGVAADLPEILADVILIGGDGDGGFLVWFLIKSLCHGLLPFLS